MLRPERMSQAKILFLKSDSETVLDTLNRHGAFHLQMKEAEGPSEAGLSEQIQDLQSRIREVIGKADVLLDEQRSVEEKALPPIEAIDWPSFIDQVGNELQGYETQTQELESKVQKLSGQKAVFDLWKNYSSSDEGARSLDFISSFKKISPLLLYPKTEEAGDLTNLPGLNLIYNVPGNPPNYLVLCLQDARKETLQAAMERGYAFIEPLEGMPSDYSNLKSYLRDFEASMERSASEITKLKNAMAAIRPRLSYLSSLLADAHLMLSIKERNSVEERWEVIEGYVPTKQGDALIKDLNTSLSGRMIYSINEEHSSNQVPVTFKYPKFIGLFYRVTNLYGVPNYN